MIVAREDDRVLEMLDESTYTFGSADNVRQYDDEYILGEARHISSVHGLVSSVGGRKVASAVLGSAGGSTGVHAHSIVMSSDACLVAVGPFVARLSLPHLQLDWHLRVDSATCFGLHDVHDGTVISHGELAISKLTPDGRILWSSGGADVFTGSIEITDDAVLVTDFLGRHYRFALSDGSG